MSSPIGVLAIQGDFDKHVEAFRTCGFVAVPVRTPGELSVVERLVIPGGESTTVGLLMERYGMGEAILKAAMSGMPLWGTCMGMILLAHRVEGYSQYTLGLLDITVQRNAFGAQVHSFEDEVAFEGLSEPVMGVFIRAPVVTQVGPQVDVLASYAGKVVAVRQGNVLGTSFHPELTDDTRLHQWFAQM